MQRGDATVGCSEVRGYKPTFRWIQSVMCQSRRWKTQLLSIKKLLFCRADCTDPVSVYRQEGS